ncbi:hypothetical protein RhiirC2_721217 [Rhizophagus irregularis]|uniref:Uncharacterized protein n=1 Tax=Rhizophagus irregularis TaxID=588596 RepID=A0A2N1M738_9GLOM|nr:hypothetical protein RhiirC2_721217 [Rhizophagus irregularis]
MDYVTSNCNSFARLALAADAPCTSIGTVDMASPTSLLLTADDVAASSSVVLSSDSHYTFYTDGSLINLGTSDVSMMANTAHTSEDAVLISRLDLTAVHDYILVYDDVIWNSCSYDKGIWEHAINITLKLKQSSRPKGLPKSSYLSYSFLPPPTHVDSRDSGTDWLMNSMKYGLFWFNHISGFMGRLTVLLNNSFCRMEC